MGGNSFDSRDGDFAIAPIEQEGLIDLGYSGIDYTWSKRQQGKAKVKQRIDRGIVNYEWIM